MKTAQDNLQQGQHHRQCERHNDKQIFCAAQAATPPGSRLVLVGSRQSNRYGHDGLNFRGDGMDFQSALFHRGDGQVAFLAAAGLNIGTRLGRRLQQGGAGGGGNFLPGRLLYHAGTDEGRPVQIQHVRRVNIQLAGQGKNRRHSDGINQTRFQSGQNIAGLQPHRPIARLAHHIHLRDVPRPDKGLQALQIFRHGQRLVGEIPDPAGIHPEEDHIALVQESLFQKRMQFFLDRIQFPQITEHHRSVLQTDHPGFDLGQADGREQPGLQGLHIHQPHHIRLAALRAVGINDQFHPAG